MKAMLLKMALPILINMVEEMITEKNLKLYGDRLFDLIEDFVTNSETDVDDKTVLPLIKAARMALGIPDNDKE